MRFKDGSFEFTESEYEEMEEGSQGICRHCGDVRDFCEPDACNYICDNCGETEVFGVPELLIMGLIEIVADD